MPRKTLKSNYGVVGGPSAASEEEFGDRLLNKLPFDAKDEQGY